MKNNLNNKKIFFILLLLITVPVIINAATPENTTIINTNIPNPLDGQIGSKMTLLDLLQIILRDIVMPIAAVVSVVYIIWAGFQYVTAQGKPAEIQKANANLLWALIGVGVLLGATGISMVIQTTVNSLIK